MSGALKLCAVFFALCSLCSDARPQMPTFGTGDVSNFLNDDKFVKKQIKCILGEGSCDNYGNQLKLAIPEVISRNCRSCSAQQAANARRLISFVQSRYPQDWQKIQARYKG